MVSSSTQIQFDFYLTFSASGAVRTTKGYPSSVARDERVMKLQSFLPRSLFTTPELRATITVPETDMPAMLINIEGAAEALKSALGVDIDLRMVSPFS